MKQVSKQEYWDFVKDKDVVMRCVGNWPYDVEWTYRNGRELIAVVKGDKTYWIKD